MAKGLVLFDDACFVEGLLHLEDGLLAVFEHRVQAAEHGHREDDVAILASDVEVA